MENIESLKKKRWFYLCVGTVLLLFLGLIYAWSVFRVPLEAEFGWTQAQTSITFSISMMMFCLGCLSGGIITGRKGHRATLVICAAVLFAGFMSASRIDSLAGIYVSYGVLCGYGVGLGYNCSISTVVRWFPDRQGLASGVSMMGFGLGALLLGTVGAKMIEVMGWRHTFMIFAVLFAVIVLVCMALLKTASQGFVDAMLAGSAKAEPSIEELGPGEMVRRKNFWLLLSWIIVLSSAGLAIINNAAPLAQTVIVGDLTKAAAVAGILSVFNGIGRVVMGIIFDRFGYRAAMLATDGLMLAGGAVLLLNIGAQSYILLVIGFILIGGGYGSIPSTFSAFAAHFFGRSHYSTNFGTLSLNLLVASYLGPLCGGGDYRKTFMCIIAFAAIGFVLTVLIKRPKAADVTEKNRAQENIEL